MTLTDAGPLVALLDRDDPKHELCAEAIGNLPLAPMLTTWPCFTEASYLLGRVGGFRYQSELWLLFTKGSLVIHDLSPPEIERVAELMETYQNVPMDLADASLVAVAESMSMSQIFTLDGDFRIYRLRNGSVLDIVP
jgi:hypothetical protein